MPAGPEGSARGLFVDLTRQDGREFVREGLEPHAELAGIGNFSGLVVGLGAGFSVFGASFSPFTPEKLSAMTISTGSASE